MGFALSAESPVPAVICWRVAFFVALGAVLLNHAVLRAAWRGKAHLWPALRRPVPFETQEFKRGTTLVPLRATGVIGRPALLGAALLLLAGLTWLGGLAFAPLDSTGTATIPAGASTSDSRPSGLMPDGLAYAFALPQEHRFLGGLPQGGALVQVADPASQQTGQYEARFGRPILLAAHRISLEALFEQNPVVGLRVEVQGQGENAVIDLRRGAPMAVGQLTLQLLEIEDDFESTGFTAYHVGLSGAGQDRSVWLIPESPEIDAAHAESPVHLRPLEVLRLETAVLRFTERWIWAWRVAVLALAGCGAFLMLLVPHRSWVWVGESGDWELVAWSINARGSLRAWSDEGLGESLGAEGFAELTAIERELGAQAGDARWT